MDNVCHTLTGAALGEAGLKRYTRFGNGVLMIAANVADMDAVAFLTSVPSVAVRRGWTHGVLAQALLPVLLTAFVVALDKCRPPHDNGPRVRPAVVLLLGYIGVLSHVGMDWLNTYGVRLLMPFSNRWFYGDAVFIVDPWLWLMLGAGVFAARRRHWRSGARLAVVLAAVYIAAMVGSARTAREAVHAAWTEANGREPHGLMVGPVPVNPLRRTIIVDAGDRYDTGSFRWPDGAVQFSGRALPRRDDHPAVVRAREHPSFRYILVWSRFPYYEVEETAGGTRVTLSDVRFGSRLATASVLVPR